jgi:signal transduction histidine kinase
MGWRAMPIALGLGLAGLLVHLLGLQPGEQTIRLERAVLITAPGEAGGRAVVLPHRWARDCIGCESAWYQFEFSLAAPPQRPQAIYLGGVGQNVALYLNGEFLGQAARFSEGFPRMASHPLLFRVDDSLWRASGNTLFAVVHATPWQRGSLGTPWIGDRAELAAVHRLQHLLRQSVVKFLGVATLVLGLVLAMVWANRRSETGYGWLALAGVAWAAAQAQHTLGVAPFNATAWDAVTAGALGVVAVALLIYAVRGLAERWRRAARAAWIVPVLLALAMAIAPAHPAFATAQWLLVVTLLLGAAALIRSGWSPDDDMRGWLSFAGSALAAVALTMAVSGPGEPAQSAVLMLAMPIVLLALSGRMLKRFVDSLQMAELLNIDLDRLVQDRTSALEAQFRRVASLKRAQAIANERERLMRDMHDGIGGHLVSTLAMLERSGQQDSAVAAAIRTALEDMRLMIDSLDPVEGDLTAVLGMFRDRIQPRLEAAGLKLEWEVQDLPALPGLGPSNVLSILRILQECVTNVLKHAGASVIGISARPSADGRAVVLRVRDDGKGFDKAAVGTGRGLSNIERRAAAMNGCLQMESDDLGTIISLTLPPGDATESKPVTADDSPGERA